MTKTTILCVSSFSELQSSSLSRVPGNCKQNKNSVLMELLARFCLCRFYILVISIPLHLSTAIPILSQIQPVFHNCFWGLGWQRWVEASMSWWYQRKLGLFSQEKHFSSRQNHHRIEWRAFEELLGDEQYINVINKQINKAIALPLKARVFKQLKAIENTN